MEMVIVLCCLTFLVAVLAVLVADTRYHLTRLEKALRERNEALASALASRPHARAFSGAPPATKPGAKLSVARVNWDRPQ